MDSRVCADYTPADSSQTHNSVQAIAGCYFPHHGLTVVCTNIAILVIGKGVWTYGGKLHILVHGMEPEVVFQ